MRMRQHIVPVCECGGRNRVRCDLESTKSPAQKVGNQGTNDHNQNGSEESEFLEFPHVGRKPILCLSKSIYAKHSECRRRSSKRPGPPPLRALQKPPRSEGIHHGSLLTMLPGLSSDWIS